MEHSISYLAFRGSIAETIAESKRQKKLFVVYISGDNAESTHLEESTWKDSNVAESISKYCILLHILEGSTDAANFSAIYPQKSVPCITAIGYNGLQLWQNEGFVGADILASSLEKAWLSLHIQETTTTFLTAALASKKSETHGTTSSNATSFEQGSSSSMDVPSPSTKNYAESLEARALASLEMENRGSDNADEGINFEVGASSGSVLANVLEGGRERLLLGLSKPSRLKPYKKHSSFGEREAEIGEMGDSRKDLLQLENKSSSSSTIESKLIICKNDLKQTRNPKPRPPNGMPLTSAVPKSQVLGKVKDFLGFMSEANKRLQDDAKDNAKNYDIEVLTGNESEYIEMDLMLGVTDLHTPEAVAAAESAIAGCQPVISLAASSSGTGSEDSSDDSSDDENDEDSEHLTSSPTKHKRSTLPEDDSSSKPLRNCDSKKRPKIVELS